MIAKAGARIAVVGKVQFRRTRWISTFLFRRAAKNFRTGFVARPGECKRCSIAKAARCNDVSLRKMPDVPQEGSRCKPSGSRCLAAQLDQFAQFGDGSVEAAHAIEPFQGAQLQPCLIVLPQHQMHARERDA